MKLQPGARLGAYESLPPSTIEGKEPKLMLEAVTNAQFVEPGYLVFVRDGTRVGRRFDLDSATPIGAAVSSDGHVVAFTSNESDRNEIYMSPYPQTGENCQYVAVVVDRTAGPTVQAAGDVKLEGLRRGRRPPLSRSRDRRAGR